MEEKRKDSQYRYVWITIDWSRRSLRFSQPSTTKYGNRPPIGLQKDSLCMGEQHCVVPWVYEDRKISDDDPRVRELFELYSDFSWKVLSKSMTIGGAT